MAPRDEDAATQANVFLTSIELKPPSMDWLVEDIHKKYQAFKTLAKIWLETSVIPDNKQYSFILQLLAKEGLCHWESPPLALSENNDKEDANMVHKVYEGSSWQTSSTDIITNTD